ncbi:hypothetical protein RchiOBHm_Chr5g0003461 [Rosa chinensis]|uniref:Uncharacterized protein n=1 Tax=Rosa chinensis TaxID=74649 RepID=A0A2P6Q2R2_ROSCH|nr:hypothetical protein RchiOBHm_Chr5g0003461 [Rosa chinensis]
MPRPTKKDARFGKEKAQALNRTNQVTPRFHVGSLSLSLCAYKKDPKAIDLKERKSHRSGSRNPQFQLSLIIMALLLRNISDLDLDDPRRWEPPEDEWLRRYWDMGRVSVSSLELFSLHEKRCNNAQEPNPRDCTPWAEQQKQSRRRRRLIHECINKKLPFSKRYGYHPCTVRVHTNVSHAKPSTQSAVTSCNCCGITHWRRHCPNRDQRAPVLGSETKSKSAAGSDRSSCEIKE